MVHYIRFLKTPQASQVKKSIKITASITITTDLGDTFFPINIGLIARLVDAANTNIAFLEKEVQWDGGQRAVTITFETNPISEPSLRLHVTTRESNTPTESFTVPKILDAWSAPFSPADRSRAPPLVERRLRISKDICVGIWEETGNSIARHMWDAAIGCLICFQGILSCSDETIDLPRLRKLVRVRDGPPLSILELGAGCGIVGITLAQMIPRCNVWLTDLADAQDILQTNIGIASLASGSSVNQSVLEWESVATHDLLSTKNHLVLVSDCTYNSDSSPDLVEALLRIAEFSSNVLILVAMKRRHDSESVFFDLMQADGFHVLENCSIVIPHWPSEQDNTAPTIEMYLYEHTHR